MDRSADCLGLNFLDTAKVERKRRGQPLCGPLVHRTAMSFAVQITQQGRGGTYYYLEHGAKLPFHWDFSSEGVEIYVPTPDEWTAYCEQHGATWAAGKRQQILERVAEEVRRRKAKYARITIEDHWVVLTFKDAWIFSLLKSLFRRSD